LRIDPELQHAAGAGEGTGNTSVALDLAGIADVDNDHVSALGGLDRLRRAQGLDLGIGFVEQRLDAAMDGLGHLRFLDPGSSFRGGRDGDRTRNLEDVKQCRDSGFARYARAPRNEDLEISAPAPSSPTPGPRS